MQTNKKIAERSTETDTIEFLSALITDVEYTIEFFYFEANCRDRRQFKTIREKNYGKCISAKFLQKIKC